MAAKRTKKPKARMGRPPLPEGEARTQFLVLRLTGAEAEELRGAAVREDTAASVYARNAALERARKARQRRREDR